jgi:hypothetical protein
VLRSIKELEFDRAMGKLAESDFEEMSARLRARAMGLMRQLDASHAGPRERIERELADRLEREAQRRGAGAGAGRSGGRASSAAGSVGSAAGVAGSAGNAGASGDRVDQQVPPPADAVAICEDCGTSNDADARFCKECGTKLARGAAHA